MRIESAALSAEVDLRRGAKITSLRDSNDVEWLAQATPASPSGPGRAFVDSEMAGWDECAPTIVACRVLDRDVPDHGDLWDVPFTVTDDTAHATGTSLDYSFSRRIVPTPTGLRLEYRAEALARSVPFLWAAHPQFAAPPGTRVQLSGVSAVIDVLDSALPERAWSAELSTIDTVPAGGCRKVYPSPGHPVNTATLVRASGESLTLRWSAECPYVGLWFDAGAYSAEPVIAIEPTTGWFDSLAVAVAQEKVPVLVPGVPLRWWVELAPDRVGHIPEI